MQIGNRTIGPEKEAFIVAEISGNHHQKYEEAAQLVSAAKDAGADAVKLQTYTPATITLDVDNDYFRVKGKDQPADWKGERLWDLYEKAHTPWEWQPKLKKIADQLGIVLFSSPFDDTAVDFLERNVGVALYKIASYEAVHIPLLRTVAKTGKPIILSIGFASGGEVELAVQTLRESGERDIALLHCVTAYSDKPDLSHMNLATIDDIRERFDVVSGFSDNNAGILVPIIAAVQHRASIIEKHLTLSRERGGPDARFSLEPQEFSEMVRRLRVGEQKGIEVAIEGIGSMADVRATKGKAHYGPASREEQENMIFRPSLWAVENIAKGEPFTAKNIRVCRPAYGLAPKYYDILLKARAAMDIERAEPLTTAMIKNTL